MRTARDLRRNEWGAMWLGKFIDELRKTASGRDLTLAQLRAELAKVGCRKTHRQIQRWAKQIPGAYRQKQGGGHWRVRVCDPLAAWLSQEFAQRTLKPIATKIERFEREVGEPYLDALEYATKRNRDELIELMAKRKPNAIERRIQRRLRQPLSEVSVDVKRQLSQRAYKLKIKLAASDLLSAGARDQKLAAATYQLLRISRSTFVRRGGFEAIAELQRNPDVLRKQKLQKKQYSNQVLEETKLDDEAGGTT